MAVLGPQQRRWKCLEDGGKCRGLEAIESRKEFVIAEGLERPRDRDHSPASPRTFADEAETETRDHVSILTSIYPRRLRHPLVHGLYVDSSCMDMPYINIYKGGARVDVRKSRFAKTGRLIVDSQRLRVPGYIVISVRDVCVPKRIVYEEL